MEVARLFCFDTPLNHEAHLYCPLVHGTSHVRGLASVTKRKVVVHDEHGCAVEDSVEVANRVTEYVLRSTVLRNCCSWTSSIQG